MVVLTAAEIRSWDQYTIRHEPISSFALMERAAGACTDIITQQFSNRHPVYIFCGKGNNGGDGLVIARLLTQLGYTVDTFILETGKSGSPDFQHHLSLLRQTTSRLHYLQSGESLPSFPSDCLVVDALVGTGLSRPLQGIAKEVVKGINSARPTNLLAIDLPSGLLADRTVPGSTAIEATQTLTFQCMKPSLLVQESAPYTGKVTILPIGLHPGYLETIELAMRLVDAALARSLYCPRSRFAHKGTNGNALLVAGSHGKMGAALLSTRACLHGGAGLTTVYIPSCGYTTLQLGAPEAMVITDESERWLATLPDHLEQYRAIGIGPGLGTKEETKQLVHFVLRRYNRPLVIDADALNCLEGEKDFYLPKQSILTPHPKEFDRLFGPHQTDLERIETAKAAAARLSAFIVLKGHHTAIVSPEGRVFFNTTGNAGMAKGGSGDVLTGLLAALLAQGYAPGDAALLGVYLHGKAGDYAAKALSQESMVASDLIRAFPKAFRHLQEKAEGRGES
jgi:hydroxyethylthiazole kinase-like uncharacterized protein yjeF